MSSPSKSISHKLTSLKQSKFISKFKLSQKDRDYIAAKGLETIKEHAFQFANSRVAPDFPKNDGKQTPMRGHPVFLAQHATATCCRGCIQKWHGIEKGMKSDTVPRYPIIAFHPSQFHATSGYNLDKMWRWHAVQ